MLEAEIFRKGTRNGISNENFCTERLGKNSVFYAVR